MKKLERIKSANLNGYLSDEEIIRVIADHLAKTKNPMSIKKIESTLRAVFKTGLSYHLKNHHQLWLQKIGLFKHTKKSLTLCKQKKFEQYKIKRIQNNIIAAKIRAKKKLLTIDKLSE